MRWLRQSTSVDLPVGPFLDETDGKTAETALTITQPDVRLKKNGGAWAQKAAAQTLSHEENGWYEVTLDATDTDTLGCLELAVPESGALQVWHEFMVLPAALWDFLFGTAGFTGAMFALDTGLRPIRSNTATAGGGSTITLDAGASAVDDFYNYLLIQIVSGTGAGQVRVCSDYVGATKVATVASAWSTNPDATSVFNLLTSAVLASSTPPSAADNATATWAALRAANLAAGSFGEGVMVAAAGIPVGGLSAGALNAAALGFDTGLKPHRSGTLQAGAAGSVTLDAGASAVDDFYKYQLLKIESGTGAGQSRMITAYVGSTKVATTSPNWATNPDNTSVFTILSSGVLAATAPGNDGLEKNVAFPNFEFMMYDEDDHLTGKTGLSITAQRSIDGGAYAACANSPAEVSDGLYKIDFAAADLNGDSITFRFTATGADPTVISVVTIV